jgi:hypothetical protein
MYIHIIAAYVLYDGGGISIWGVWVWGVCVGGCVGWGCGVLCVWGVCVFVINNRASQQLPFSLYNTLLSRAGGGGGAGAHKYHI